MAHKEETEAVPCMYTKCDKKENKLLPYSERVEIKSYVPAEKVNRSDFLVRWKKDGQATLHTECWKDLLDTVKGTEDAISSEEKKMIKEAKKTAEYFDSQESIKKEGKRVAQMIQSSSHVIVFTGAGISTAAGIGDFRGKGGKWTERDRAKEHGKTSVKKKPEKKARVYAPLRPTYTHEAIAKLVELGHIKYVISQNVDGLHRLSGIPQDRISELHGNAFFEKCEKCGTRYERTFPVGGKSKDVPAKRCNGCHINHRTGRKCEKKKCDGYLMNTIINFGDNLEGSVIDGAEDQSEERDLMICLGSSLTVTPASDLVEYGKKPLKVVICNRQPTQYDDLCEKKQRGSDQSLGVRVFGDCDVLMTEIMKGVLSPEALKEWEAGRDRRMVTYDKQRIKTDK